MDRDRAKWLWMNVKQKVLTTAVLLLAVAFLPCALDVPFLAAEPLWRHNRISRPSFRIGEDYTVSLHSWITRARDRREGPIGKGSMRYSDFQGFKWHFFSVTVVRIDWLAGAGRKRR